MTIACIALFICIILIIFQEMRIHDLRLENYELIENLYFVKNELKKQKEEQAFRDGYLI
jgi:hypothetical protein